MKFLILFFFFIIGNFSAQKVLPIDTLKVKNAENIFFDDYGNVYFYEKKDFSFTKIDSVGKQLGKMRLTFPYKIQDIQNPLNIVMFSENAQEIKFVDQNLVEIQKINLSKFGFVKMAFVEDQQQVWLLDESTKRLLQYRFRKDEILQSYPVYFDVEKAKDFLIFDDKMYVLTEKDFSIYNFKGNLLYNLEIKDSVRLRRENDAILIVCNQNILKIDNEWKPQTIFSKPNATIVDKNNNSYFEVIDNKIYLYPIQKKSE